MIDQETANTSHFLWGNREGRGLVFFFFFFFFGKGGVLRVWGILFAGVRVILWFDGVVWEICVYSE